MSEGETGVVPQEEIKESVPVSYPHAKELKESELTEEVINKSVDEYIAWRRQHESDEGVLEPGRAEVLVHTTSIEGALNIASDGSLKSIYSLITSENPRVDLMQGGKAKYVRDQTKKLVTDRQDLQELILQKRREILRYAPWISDLVAVEEDLDSAKDFEDLIYIVRGIVNEGYEKGYFRESRGMLEERHSPWLYVANLLPQEARRTIAEEAKVEKYVSFTLGHALEKYTPDARDSSRQAAIITDVDRFSLSQRYEGGGTANFRQFSQERWNEIEKELKEKPSNIFSNEYYGGGATEVNILKGNSDNGVVVDVSKNSSILMPASKRRDIEASHPALLDNIVWFDDEKFRSINEALGWLMATSEGRKLYEEKKGK